MQECNNLDLFDTYISIYDTEFNESWYSGKGQYRTTASGRKVRWDEDERVDDQVSAMMQKRREEAAKKAATERLKAKRILPIRKPQQNEEFSDYIDNLQSEGYDLSNWTWEGIEEFYVTEAKKMKGEDPCWKGYEMVGTKKKDGKEVPNCVPKEETEYVDEGKKRFPTDKVGKKAAKHERDYLTRPNSYSGQQSKSRANKMKAIASTVNAGADPRKTMHGQDLRKLGKPEFNEDVNIYDIVLAHLIDEGYAETLEAAEVILENMSDTWIENILEDYKEFPTSKVMKKAGDLMGSSAGKSDEKSKKKEKRGIKMMDVMMQHTPDR